MDETKSRPGADEMDLKRTVYEEEMKLILEHTPFGSIVSTIFACVVVYPIWTGTIGVSIGGALVASWLVAKISVAAVRLGHSLRCKNLAQAGKAAPYGWIVPLLGIDGLVWGVGGVYMAQFSSNIAGETAAILCCIACVATFGLQVRVAAAAAYTIPMLAPMSVALLIRDDFAGTVGGIGLGLFLLLLMRTSRRWQGRISEIFELRAKTEQATVEISEALELARQHARAKDRFLATVSHELRTPLHGILGLVNLTRRDLSPGHPAIASRLSLIEDAAVHLRRLVSDLLDISSLESGRLQLNVEAFDLQRELDFLQESWSLRCREAGLVFQIMAPPSLGRYVMGDRVRLAQVLSNLIGNAFKFTPLGGSIFVQATRMAGTDDVMFRVRDTGRGIKAEDIDRIFDAFVQLQQKGGDQRPEGVGLGLAISRQLAVAMGGDLTCTSALGAGSTFTFTAKLPTTDECSLPQTSAPAPLQEPPTEIFTGVAAVADDDPVSLILASAALRNIGWQVEEYADSSEFLNRFIGDDQSRPDLAVIDWDMPGITGDACSAAIRTHEVLHRLPRAVIVCASGNATAEYQELGRLAGFDAFLAKPFTVKELQDVLLLHIRKSPTPGIHRGGDERERVQHPPAQR